MTPFVFAIPGLKRIRDFFEMIVRYINVHLLLLLLLLKSKDALKNTV